VTAEVAAVEIITTSSTEAAVVQLHLSVKAALPLRSIVREPFAKPGKSYISLSTDM
jgi:hypothetical protein